MKTTSCTAAPWIALLLIACKAAPTATATAASGAPAAIRQPEAEAVLAAQVARWNAGDLPGFVSTYWDGPELSFFGRSGLTRGRDDLLATYQRSYPTARERGVLSFATIAFEPLGTDHALLLGRYHIERDPPADGVFSLVLTRQRGQVVILHDHTTEVQRPR
jgi:Domain of unknown function (DUF4440)